MRGVIANLKDNLILGRRNWKPTPSQVNNNKKISNGTIKKGSNLR